jgi:hypothetical protein
MPTNGPHVIAAAVCDKVLQETDGVLSLIRVVDRMVIQVAGNQAPPELPEGGGVSITFAVLLRSGDARGRHPVAIGVEAPDGRSLPPQQIDVMFESPDTGANIVLNLVIPAMEGIYWLTVSVEGRELTRSPLRIMYQRIPGFPGSPEIGQFPQAPS